jgi:hypothetical protein
MADGIPERVKIPKLDMLFTEGKIYGQNPGDRR